MKKIISLLIIMTNTLFSQTNINVTFRSQLPYPGLDLANIWGYAQAGKEYALVGVQNGLSIVDVTIPTSPATITTIPGISSSWREVKAYKNYAYVVSEGGGGLQIINLSNLPSASLTYSNYSGNGAISGQLNKNHSIHIDTTKKVVYIFGSDNLANGGVLAFDISATPMNPNYLGQYNARYVHDGYADNDTVYAGAINDGKLAIINFTNKSAPVEITNWATPGNFTHNAWLTADRKTLLTTDEVSNSFLASYDISNLSSVKFLDKIQSNPGSNSIVHNTHIINGWAVTSWYRDGITIVDANKPDNLIQVGNYDTYPGSGNGFDGAWGVYPYLPSGNILVSGINEGLFVLGPTYVRACYLEGFVTDSICNTPLQGVTVNILTATNATTTTDVTGSYKTGYYLPGTYTVTFSKPGYTSKTITGVNLSAATITNINLKLFAPSSNSFSGYTEDAMLLSPLNNVSVEISNTTNSYTFSTNALGSYSTCSLISGTYNIYQSKWGYKTYCSSNNIINSTSNSFSVSLTKGYYDDFVSNLGWSVTGTSSNSWEIGIPVATYNGTATCNPGSDILNDCSNKAYVTDNGGGGPWDNDVDGGYTQLASPIFDLTGYTNPYVKYYRWFYDGGTANGAPNDTFKVTLSNGTTQSLLEVLTPTSTANGTWVQRTFKVSTYLAPTNNMQIKFYTADYSPANIVEGGVDRFEVIDSIAPLGVNGLIDSERNLVIYPNPANDWLNISLNDRGNIQSVAIYNSLGELILEENYSGKTAQINLQSYAAGLYYLKVKCNDKEYTNKFTLIKHE